MGDRNIHRTPLSWGSTSEAFKLETRHASRNYGPPRSDVEPSHMRWFHRSRANGRRSNRVRRDNTRREPTLWFPPPLAATLVHPTDLPETDEASAGAVCAWGRYCDPWLRGCPRTAVTRAVGLGGSSGRPLPLAPGTVQSPRGTPASPKIDSQTVYALPQHITSRQDCHGPTYCFAAETSHEQPYLQLQDCPEPGCAACLPTPPFVTLSQQLAPYRTPYQGRAPK